MELKNKNILITGCTGLVGSWLAESLLKENSVFGIAIDDSLNFLLESKNLINSFDITYLNIANFENLHNYFLSRKFNFDIVIHLAAQTQVIDAYENPRKTFEYNIQGTWNLYEICRVNNIPIINASSDKSYGSTDNLPYKEDHPLNGVHPYEISKSVGDNLASSFIKTYNSNITSLRCGNIYGGGDLNWDRLVPGVTKALLKKDRPVLRSDGSYTRDWVYVEDVSNAYSKVALNILEGEKVSNFYNFSSKEYFSVMDIYNELCLLIHGEIVEPIYEINSEFEIKDQQLDSSKILNELNIGASESLSSGLKKTITWYENFLNHNE